MKKRFKLLFGLVLTLALVLTFAATALAADQPATPDVGKTVDSNGNGTYTISLSITGDADKSATITPTNVIMILDASNSMYSNSTPGEVTYTETDGTGNGLYGLIDGEYVPLTRQGGPGNRTFWYNGVQYTGQRYIRTQANLTRMEATLNSMEGVAQTLLSKNGADGNPADAIEVALIVFSGSTQTAIELNPTTSYSSFETAAEEWRPNHPNNHGTSWSTALGLVDDVNFNDSDQTFVIFFTDGAPTTDGDFQTEPEYQAALPIAANIVNSDTGLGYTMFSIFAFGDGENYLRQLTNYAYTGTESTADSAYFYSATNAAALQEAFDDILEKIELAGIAEAEMDDGVSVKDPVTSQKLIDLVEVVPNSYKYYRAGGVVEGSTSPKYSTTANNGLGEEWTDIPNDCKAKVVDGEVVWDLAKATDTGVLEDEVVYTVTFECATSQDALDMIAELKNGTIELVKDGDPDDPDVPNVPAAIAPYITKDGDDYTMLTNSGLTVKYKDTRVGDDVIDYDPEITIDPVPIDAEPISIEKLWVGTYQDEQSGDSIVIGIMMDGEDSDAFELTRSGNKHTGSRFISTGVMTADTNGNVNTVVAGHDFELTEKVEGSTVGYHWELQAETMHPMLINNELTMLVLVEDTTEVPSGVTATKTVSKTVDGEQVAYYKIGDNFYKESAESAALTATNFRRSNLYFTKTVEGAGVPDDAVFPFTFNVVNSEAPASAPSENDDPNHESDWWVWFSVRDKDGNRITQGVTGATHDSGGYWYAPSGQDVTIPVQAGYSIRVGNLPSGTTYTITEGELEEGFSFKESKLTYTTELEGITNADTSFAGAQTTTGTIQLTNTEYTVTYTNKYEMSTVQVVKTFSGISEDQVPADFTATVSYEVADGAPAGTVKPADVVLTIPAAASDDEGSGEQILRAGDTTDAIVPEVSDDGLTYTWTIERVPVGLDVTVTESGTDVDGYTLITQGNDASVTEAASTKATEAGAITTLNLTNKYEVSKGDLKITKTVTPADLANAPSTYYVTVKQDGADGKYVALDANNKPSFSDTASNIAVAKGSSTVITGLPVGKYIVEEVTSGSNITVDVPGYTLETTYAPTDKAAEVTKDTVGDDAATVTITNAYTKKTDTARVDDSATFNKVDQDEAALSGATFTLKSGNDTVATYTSQSFSISTEDAALADYLPAAGSSATLTLSETTVPAGYTKADDVTITISATENEALDTATDTYITTTTYAMSVSGATAVEGAEDTYKVTDTKKTDTARVDDSATFNKVDQDEAALSGATFTLKSGNDTVATYTSQSFSISTEDAALADYLPAAGSSATLTLSETTAPAGYTKAADVTITISATENEALDTATDTYITTTTYAMSVSGATAVEGAEDTYKVTDTKKTDTARVDDSATFNKVDQDEAALSGATFTLKSGNDTVATYTNQSFSISTSDTALAGYLPAVGSTATLTLTETTAPGGYAKASDVTITISATENEELDTATDTYITTTTYAMSVSGATAVEGAEDTYKVTDTKKTGEARVDTEVTVQKLDQDEAALEGATFTLADADGEPVKTFTGGEFTISTSDTALKDYLPTTNGGTATLTLTESEPPAGYEGAEGSYDVTITTTIEEALDETQDVFITTTTYDLTISGAEEETETVDGVEQTKLVLEVVNTKKIENEYIYGDEGDDLTVNKKDAETGEALAGATFTLTYGGVTVEKITDDQGVASFDLASFSEVLPKPAEDPDAAETTSIEMTLEETAAPEGYVLPDETQQTVTVSITVSEPELDAEKNAYVITTTYAIDGDKVVAVENEPENDEGMLKIVKTFDGPADLPETTKFKITGPDYNETVSIKDFEQTGEGEYTYEVEVPAGEYTVTENKSSAMVDGYTLHILGDNGVPRQVDENGYTFRIRNRYADPSDKYVPEELNGEDHYAYMIGYPDGLVHPERNITRAEVATIFFRLLTDEAREANLSTVNSFGDVEDGMWFNVSVSTMANMGIVNGYPDGDFHPNDNITRAEFAAIAARFDKEAKDSANIFTDIDGHWAKSYILRAVNRGWINGYPDSTFRPDRLATRAEVAAMVNRVLVRDPEDPDDLLPDMIEWPDNMDTRAWYYLDIQEATNTHEYERQTKPTEVWMQILENPDWTKYQY